VHRFRRGARFLVRRAGFAETRSGAQSWFQKSEPFDAEIRRRFLVTWERTARGELGSWANDPLASLALSDARQFRAICSAARRARSRAIPWRLAAGGNDGAGFDRLFQPSSARLSICPFAHAEDLAAQRALSPCFQCSTRSTSKRQRHYEIVARFGRFPHRNAALRPRIQPPRRSSSQTAGILVLVGNAVGITTSD